VSSRSNAKSGGRPRGSAGGATSRPASTKRGITSCPKIEPTSTSREVQSAPTQSTSVISPPGAGSPSVWAVYKIRRAHPSTPPTPPHTPPSRCRLRKTKRKGRGPAGGCGRRADEQPRLDQTGHHELPEDRADLDLA